MSLLTRPMEDRLRPKNPVILPQPIAPVIKPQSESKPKKLRVRKARKNTSEIEKKTDAKQSDFSDFEKKTMSFCFIDATRIHNPPLLLEFVRWNVIPPSARAEYGVPITQKDFAERYEVSVDTLSDWKRLPLFWDEVALHRKNDFRRFTSEVYYGLVKRAKTGDPRAVELFAQLFEGFSEKVRVEDETPPKELSPEEVEKVRHAIYHIGLKAIVKRNKVDDEEGYEKAVLG